MLIIDTHAHIYGDDDKKYPVMEKPYRPPSGKGTLAHLRREVEAVGVRYVVAIQTKTYYNWDNRFVTDASRANRDWMVGVVTLDPDDPHSSGLLEKYVREYNVRALRSIPAKSGRLDDPGVVKLWETARKSGALVNVLVGPQYRDELTALLTRFRDLPVVLDHCMDLLPGSAGERIRKVVLQLARQPNLYAKLSYIPVHSGEAYPFKDLHEATRQIIRAYGPERCMWGSDFPCELWCPKATYAQHLRLFTHELGLDRATQEAILGTTPRKLFFPRVAG